MSATHDYRHTKVGKDDDKKKQRMEKVGGNPRGKKDGMMGRVMADYQRWKKVKSRKLRRKSSRMQQEGWKK